MNRGSRLAVTVRAATGQRAYLRGDSHWHPAAMEAVAVALARQLRKSAPLPPPELALRRTESRVRSRGDSVALLGLPAWAPLYPLEEVTIRPVVQAADGAPWRPAGGAP